MFYKSLTLFATAIYEWSGASPDPNPVVRVSGRGYGPGVNYQLNYNTPHAIGAITGTGDGIQGEAGWGYVRAVIIKTLPILSGQDDPIGLTGEVGTAHSVITVRAVIQPLDTKFGLTGEIGTGIGYIPAIGGDGRCENGAIGSGYGRLAPVQAHGTQNPTGFAGSGYGTILVIGASSLSYTEAASVYNEGHHRNVVLIRGRSKTVNQTGVVDAVNTVYAMNLSTGAVSQHTTQFNSWCVLNGDLYAADSSGIHLVRGFTDNGTPITSRISKIGMDMGTPFNKFFTDVFFRGRTTGNHKITVSSERATGSVTMVDGVEEYHGAKADLPKGVYGRELGITVENVDGAQFEWSEMEIICGESQNRRGRQISRG